MAYIVYAIYNLFYLAFTGFFFLYANTYLNGFFIPNSFRWKDGHVREDMTAFGISQVLILFMEAALFAYLLWLLNKWFLSVVAKSDIAASITMWTVITYSVIAIGIIAMVLPPHPFE